MILYTAVYIIKEKPYILIDHNQFWCNIPVCPHVPVHIRGIRKGLPVCVRLPRDCTVHHLILCTRGVQELRHLFTFARVGVVEYCGKPECYTEKKTTNVSILDVLGII